MVLLIDNKSCGKCFTSNEEGHSTKLNIQPVEKMSYVIEMRISSDVCSNDFFITFDRVRVVYLLP